MRNTLTLGKRRYTVEISYKSLMFKTSGFQISAYWVPTISCEGKCTWWPQRSAYYKHGFIARFYWFGFGLRYGAVR